MSSRSAGIRSWGATLRRRAGLLFLASLVGFGAGVGYVLVVPPPLTSSALVLLPTAAVSKSANSDVSTQVQIVLSATILQQAAEAVRPTLTERQVRKLVKVSAATTQLIEIDATSPNPAVAQGVAQAVADAYVAYVRDTAREVTKAALADLANRRDDLQNQIGQLQQEIVRTTKRQKAARPESAEARTEAQLLAGLRTQQADLVLQLDKVKDSIAAGTPVGTAASGTQIVQQATVPEGSPLPVRLLLWAPLGAVGGIVLAGSIVLALARRDPRLRIRDEIADAIGSPVLASVRSRPQRSVAGWFTLLQSYQGTPMESWAFRQVLRGLAPKGQPRVAGRLDHPEAVTVVSIAGDERGLAVGPQLAAFASSLGVDTRLVPTAGQDHAPTLWACLAEWKAPSGRPLTVGGASSKERADLTIFVVIVDRSAPRLAATGAGSATIISVAAGAATEQELARVAVAFDDAGQGIDGVVVADPDQTDRTTGRHTVADRSQWPALPTRLTGVEGPAAVRESQRGRP